MARLLGFGDCFRVFLKVVLRRMGNAIRLMGNFTVCHCKKENGVCRHTRTLKPVLVLHVAWLLRMIFYRWVKRCWRGKSGNQCGQANLSEQRTTTPPLCDFAGFRLIWGLGPLPICFRGTS